MEKKDPKSIGSKESRPDVQMKGQRWLLKGKEQVEVESTWELFQDGWVDCNFFYSKMGRLEYGL